MASGDPEILFTIRNLSRRGFLRDAGLAGAGLLLGLEACGGGGSENPASQEPIPPLDPIVPGEPPEPSLGEDVQIQTFVGVGADGGIEITVHRSEMGQGVRTALAMLVAEELRVDWQDVVVVQALSDPKYGDQNTDGSRSIRQAWEPLRRAGAAAREMLEQAGAARFGVGVGDVEAREGTVRSPSGEELTYAELAADAAALPVPTSSELTPSSAHTIIGRRQEGVDNRAIVTGRASYGIDVEVEGMLHASIERAPTVWGRVVSYNESAARAVPGVRQVIQLKGDVNRLLTSDGVAVLADNTWAAMQGRRALAVEWDTSDATENTARHRAQLQALVEEPQSVVVDEGDFDAAQGAAARVWEAQYETPYLAHAPMEPLAATVQVDAQEVRVWAPVQDPQRARAAVAALLGRSAAEVTVRITLLGGGFGRKSQPDFILEAAALANEAGVPVKVTWTREDEIRHGFYRPETRQLLRASLDENNRVTGLLGRTVFPSLAKVFSASAVQPLGAELDMGWTNLPYEVADLRMEAGGISSDLRIGWWRSVCNSFHAFAVQSFVDELAAQTGRHHVELQRELLGPDRVLSFPGYQLETARLRGVIDKAAGMGLYGRATGPGEGVGFAAHFSFQSYVAMAMLVRVDSDRRVIVEEVDYAVDCGQIVHPDGVRAQVEGGLVFGLSAALFGELNVEEGSVVEGNFDTYPMLRIDRMPRVNVEIIASEAPPTGIGEPPTSPVAAALTNAVYAATGERIRELPLTRHGYS